MILWCGDNLFSFSLIFLWQLDGHHQIDKQEPPLTMLKSRNNPLAGKGSRKPITLRHLVASTMAFAMLLYLLFLSSVMSPSQPEPVSIALTKVANQESRSVQISTDRIMKVDNLDVEMAEFAYENQKGERNERAPVSEAFAKYGANWPCFWGETAVGDLNTFQTRWDKYKDGWKYVCGLSYITEPCVVYSLGSSGNMAFEKDLLKKGDLLKCAAVSVLTFIDGISNLIQLSR